MAPPSQMLAGIVAAAGIAQVSDDQNVACPGIWDGRLSDTIR